jgi:hypothetical protein
VVEVYAVHASTRIALNSGLSQTEVEALTAHGPVVGIDSDIVLIARMADDLAPSESTCWKQPLGAGVSITRGNLS